MKTIDMILNFGLFIIAFAFMESVAWFSHRYLMHGSLWFLHKDHHIKPGTYSSFFEKNDYFFLIFATPAALLLIAGIALAGSALIFAGAGISLYGLTYFIIHEVIIHKRLRVNINIRSNYMKALIRAHQAHHSPKNKDEFSSFGLLVFPARYFMK
jgi:beta-carotene 3-hydroxylase